MPNPHEEDFKVLVKHIVDNKPEVTVNDDKTITFRWNLAFGSLLVPLVADARNNLYAMNYLSIEHAKAHLFPPNNLMGNNPGFSLVRNGVIASYINVKDFNGCHKQQTEFYRAITIYALEHFKFSQLNDGKTLKYFADMIRNQS